MMKKAVVFFKSQGRFCLGDVGGVVSFVLV